MGKISGTGQAFAQRNEVPAGYPQSLEPASQALLGRLHEGNPSPGLLVRLAEAYFDLADDLLTDEAKRRAAYEAGAMAAKQAIELDESNADAHFFHLSFMASLCQWRGTPPARKGGPVAGIRLKQVAEKLDL
jgi:hypothetical protein